MAGFKRCAARSEGLKTQHPANVKSFLQRYCRSRSRATRSTWSDCSTSSAPAEFQRIAAVPLVDVLLAAYGSYGCRCDREADCADGEYENVRGARGLGQARWHQKTRTQAGERVGRGVAIARDSGVHGRVQDEQTLCSQFHQMVSFVKYLVLTQGKKQRKRKSREQK